MKKKDNIKPNGLAYFIYYCYSKITAFFRGYKIDNKVLKEQVKKSKQENKGFMVIYNHSGFYDHVAVTAGMAGNKTNYVLAKYFTYQKAIYTVTSMVKSIYKDQFTPDLQAIRKMKRAIDRPGIIAIAPTGQISVDGGDQFMSFGIVKLVRLCKCDVLGYKIQGMHFAKPKWAKTKRKCQVSCEFVKVIDKEELATLSDQEIYNRILEIGSLNLQDYQEKTMSVIKGKDLASGLEGELYMCPKCKQVHKNYTVGDKLICSVCGNTVVYNKFGFLEVQEGSVGFKREDEWYKFQRDEIKKQLLENDDFHLEGEFSLHRNMIKENVLEEYAVGTVHLTKERLYFEGTVKGEPYSKEFVLKSIFQFPHTTGVSFFVPDDEGPFKFFPTKQNTLVNHFVQTIEAMREIEEAKGKVF